MTPLTSDEKDSTKKYLKEMAFHYLTGCQDEVSIPQMLMYLYGLSRDDNLIMRSMNELLMEGSVLEKITLSGRILIPIRQEG